MYEKIYPPLEPSAPIDDQVYRMKKVEELEKFLRSEIEKREQLAKKFKRYRYNNKISRHTIGGNDSHHRRWEYC